MNAAAPSSRSPRSPSIPLDEALERASKLYAKEGRHATSIDVIAQGMGYKDGKNGRAKQSLASLRYYGLLDRPKEGFLAVSKDFESYQFAPTEDMKRTLVLRMLKTPAVFAELLEKYQARLPSEATIKFDLIQRGFSAIAAEALVAVFLRSVSFAKYYDAPSAPVATPVDDELDWDTEVQTPVSGEVEGANPQDRASMASANVTRAPVSVTVVPENMIRVPVRLTQGRQAWIELPIPFFEADKNRLKAYIDLQLADDEVEGNRN